MAITLCGSLSLHPGPLGAAMHNAGYRALGLAFTYVPFRTSDLSGATAGMRALGIRGFGVSYPYKQEIMRFLDAMDPLAKQIGAVNTVVNTEGHLVGHNTDWIGAVRALEERMPVRGKRILLLGAGGAARAAAFGLAHHGGAITIANRSIDKGQALADETSAHFVPLAEVRDLGAYDAVVNATSCGMHDVDPAPPLSKVPYPPSLVAMDMVYQPLRTRFLDEASRAGVRTIHGGRMLLHQAAAQFELYTKIQAPLEAMDAALRAASA